MADDTLFHCDEVEKRCRQCKTVKPIEAFVRVKGNPWRLCKTCNNDNRKRFVARHPGYGKEWKKAWYLRNKDYHARKSAEHYHKDIELSRLRQTARRYELTVEQLKELYERGGTLCHICERPERTGRNGRLFVDHCHDTGRIRGLLCKHCNWALGTLGDTPEKIARVLAYIRGELRQV